jgi:hypothetical protein
MQVQSFLKDQEPNTVLSSDVDLDPHAGNLLIRPSPPYSRSPYNFEIALLDHGLVGIALLAEFSTQFKGACFLSTLIYPMICESTTPDYGSP